jgi:hypothetical protein
VGCDGAFVQRHKLGFKLGQELRFTRGFMGRFVLDRSTQAASTSDFTDHVGSAPTQGLLARIGVVG